MSELTTTTKHKDLRWQLLATVSAASLLAGLSLPDGAAMAQDADHPSVWIELGGQLEALQGREEPFAAPFVIKNLNMPLNAVPLTTAQMPPHHAFGGEGKISFEPKGSDWVFSAAVRYGRSNSKGKLHQQTSTQFVVKTAKYDPAAPKFFTNTVTRFNDTAVRYHTSHAIVDFMAGKDVGLGLIGRTGSSTLNFGVRIAQLERNSDINFHSFPDPYYKAKVVGQALLTANFDHHHSYYARAQIDRNFHGVGPSISWDGSAPFLGNHDAGEVTFDWGANAAALFGRQKVHGSHKTTSLYFLGQVSRNAAGLSRMYTNAPISRSHSALVPNVGGFAGVSVKYPNAKLSLGYRADFFFNAMDQGVDSRKSETVGFYGPFATISIGMGG